MCPQIIKQSIVELRLQAEDSFLLKVVQLEELLQVRHSVFVIGNAGSGKSQARHPCPCCGVPPAGSCKVPAQWWGAARGSALSHLPLPQGPQPSASWEAPHPKMCPGPRRKL